MSIKFKLACASVIAAVILSTAPLAAQTLRIAGNFPVEHSSSKAVEIFAAAVAEKSGGGLKIATFPAMQLGGAKENVDQVRSGVIFGAWIGTAYLSRTVSELEAVSLPFAYPDREAAFRALRHHNRRVAAMQAWCEHFFNSGVETYWILQAALPKPSDAATPPSGSDT